MTTTSTSNIATAGLEEPDADQSSGTPKASADAGKIPVRNWWHMLLYAWDLAEFKDRFETQFEDAPDLRTLLTAILTELVKMQVRRGLRGEYVERSEQLPGVRGSIDFNRTLNELTLYRGRLHCEYEEFTLNVPRSQIVRSSLHDALNLKHASVETEPVKYKTLMSDIQFLLRMMYIIDIVPVTRRIIASEMRKLGQNEREYRLILMICEMLRDPNMPQSDAASDTEFVNWFYKQKFRLFENFVANFYKLHLRRAGWDVAVQPPQTWNALHRSEDSNVGLPQMRPDIVLTHRKSEQRIVIDTKWYGSVTTSRYDTETVHSSNLYQMYAYLASQDHHGGSYRTATGILIYGQPADGEVKLRTQIDAHPFWVETLDLAQEWQKIERDLSALIDDAASDLS